MDVQAVSVHGCHYPGAHAWGTGQPVGWCMCAPCFRFVLKKVKATITCDDLQWRRVAQHSFANYNFASFEPGSYIATQKVRKCLHSYYYFVSFSTRFSDNIVEYLTPRPHVELLMRRTKIREVRRLAQLNSSKWVWIVHHVLSVFFRRIER